MGDEGQGRTTPDLGLWVDVAVRLGAVAVLGFWCFGIVAPFLSPIVWGTVIAVAVATPYAKLRAMLGGRSGRAAAVLVLVGLLGLIVPAAMLSETLVSGARNAADAVAKGELEVPPPPPQVANWPLVGDTLYPQWQQASRNLERTLERAAPQLLVVSRWLLAAAGSAGAGVLQFMLSIVIAGFLLANSESGETFARRLARRIVPRQGDAFIALARSTVTSVATGVIGVAIIQAVLAGVGFMAAGVPAAGLWALIVLVSAVVQFPVLLVMVPVIIWVYSAASSVVAILFLVWSVVVSLLDNVLKPIMFGRGVQVPILVIFLGSIGGMISYGIIGLFIGPVILAVGYEVFGAWLAEGDAVAESQPVE